MSAPGNDSLLGDGLGNYPRRCVYGDLCLLGGPIRITGDEPLWFQVDARTGQACSMHVRCWREHGWPEGMLKPAAGAAV